MAPELATGKKHKPEHEAFLDKLQNRFRKLRSTLKGWNINYECFFEKQKIVLSNDIDEIDKESVVVGLSSDKYILRKQLEDNLRYIRKEEQVKWFQRGKDTNLLQGDSRSAYYMAKASGRNRKNKITSLCQDNATIVGDKDILEFATNFYRGLFGPISCDTYVALDIPVEPLLNEKDKFALEKPFSMEEIKEVVFNMKHNKAPGPDGFPIEFYQHYWDLVCDDLLFMFNEFYQGRLDTSRLNYGNITLLLKCSGADSIQKYRPICLLNVLFNFFTKVQNNRVVLVADKCTSKIQNNFY